MSEGHAASAGTLTGAEGPAPVAACCLFSCRSRRYAVRLDAVEEVNRVDSLVRLPLGPPRLAGLCVVRRAVVPVFWMDPPEADDRRAAGEHDLVLVLRIDHGSWGLLIDAEGIVVHQDGPAPESGPAEGVDPGRIVRDGKVYEVLDPAHTWHDLRMTVDAWYRSCVRSTRDAIGPGGSSPGSAGGSYRSSPARTTNWDGYS
jgi:chemotaxis signal transduction protein